jgi:orotidine-5'-phosphate decarboxylase
MSAAALRQQELTIAREKLIVALDFATPREAEAVVRSIGDEDRLGTRL